MNLALFNLERLDSDVPGILSFSEKLQQAITELLNRGQFALPYYKH